MTKSLFGTLGMAVGDDISIQAMAPVNPDAPQDGEPILASERRTLGDIAMEAAEKAKTAAAASVAPAAAPPPGAPGAPASAAPVVPAAAAPTAPAAKPIEIKRPAVDDLAAKVTKDVLAEVKKLQTPPAAATATPATPTTVTPSLEAQWEAALPEENRDELELLRWGEQNGIDGLKGKATEKAAYLRRLEDFTKSNPDEETLKEWTQKNEPIVPMRLLRKTAEQRLLKQAREEAAEEIRKENEPRMAEVEARQRAAEVRPLVDQAANEFMDRFERKDEKTTAGTPRIAGAVATMIKTQGIQAAAETFPIEAPVIHQLHTAARALLDLRSGLIAHDPTNPTHQWLGQFVMRQEQALLSKPEDQRVLNGKIFLPAQVYYSELAKNPAIAQQYTTFNDQNLLDMLEETAHRMVKKEHDKLEKAGFRRTSPVVAPGDPNKPVEQTAAAPASNGASTNGQQPTAEDPNAAPRGGASRAPGAAVGADSLNPNIDAMKKFFPGMDVERILA